jgi:hypothetical protein
MILHGALLCASEMNWIAICQRLLKLSFKAAVRYDLGITIALAALIVIISVAQLAWEIYRDLKKNSKAAPVPEVITRRLRLESKVTEQFDSERRDRIVNVVVEELMRQPPAD